MSTQTHQLWINGAPTESLTGETFARVNPYDGMIAGTYANADARDTERAIAAARHAFDSGPWRTVTSRTRHDVLLQAAALVRRDRELLAEMMVRESGKPVSLALGEVEGAARTFEYNAGLALSTEGSAISERNHEALGLVLKEPVGVAGLITAWNFPILGVVNKAAPALAAGCTVVAKPSHLCAGPAVHLAALLTEAGLPDGVFNLVTSDRESGAIAGQAIAASTHVDKVAFTGSTSSGKAVIAASTSNVKKLSLELGGKSPNIVFADADLDAAATTAITAFCFNSGQQCSAGSRLLVEEEIYDEFLKRIAAAAVEQVLGDPADPATTMGPLITPVQHQKVREYVEIGRVDGRIVVGGMEALPAPLRDSQFVPPTIVADLPPTSRLVREEVFGPVLAVLPFRSEKEAVALANDTDYGLAGGVWTRDISRAVRVAKSVRTGKMFVNAYNTAGLDDMPHGGSKQSGYGREFGLEGLDQYLERKTVQVKL